MIPSPFHSLNELLLDGKDARLHLDERGRNHYFCMPQVQENLHLWGSSTASNISPKQWQHAQTLWQQMRDDVQTYGIEISRTRDTSQVQHELQQCLQLPETSSVILAESGTDAHRQWMQHLIQQHPQDSWCIIMPEALETGRSIPEALTPKASHICIRSFALRDPQGQPRTRDAIKMEVTQHLKHAIHAKQRILLIMVDASKTGCLAPHPDDIDIWNNAYHERLHVLVDACQGRLGMGAIHAYLQQGACVAITGSKFWGAPSFCAALLVPKQHQPPQATTASFGMLLRWQLALHTMRQCHALGKEACQHAMQRISHSIQQHMRASPHLQPLSTDGIARPQEQTIDWNQYPSIFPFFIRHKHGLMSHRQALQLYQALQSDTHMPIQMGRPIPIPKQKDDAGLFRLCISAPLMIQEAQHATVSCQQVPQIIQHIERCSHTPA